MTFIPQLSIGPDRLIVTYSRTPVRLPRTRHQFRVTNRLRNWLPKSLRFAASTPRTITS